MRLALANWSSCTGTQINSKNLNLLLASEVAAIQSSASSVESLKNQLCALANPVMNCSFDLLAAVKQVITPAPKAPPILCQVDPDQYGHRVAGTDSMNFRLRGSGCDHTQLQLVFSSETDYSLWGSVYSFGSGRSWQGTPCSTLSGPTLSGGNVTFQIYVDPTKFVSDQGGGNASCAYKLMQGDAQIISSGMWISSNCMVSPPGNCEATGLSLANYQTEAEVLGCTDFRLQSELQTQSNVLVEFGQPPVVGLQFSDRTWFNPDIPVNQDIGQPDGQIYEVCSWRKP